MPLRGIAVKYWDQKENDFNLYDWWKALVDKGIPPSEAWQLDFTEAVHMLDLEPPSTDTTFALYHQRKSNGAPKECLTQNL